MPKKILTKGQKFPNTKLSYQKTVAPEPYGNQGHKRTVIRCDCDCGGTIDVVLVKVTRQLITSCGCEPQPEKPKAQKFYPKGYKFEGTKLTVIRQLPINERPNPKYRYIEVECECGNIISPLLCDLLVRATTSCGCNKFFIQGRPDDYTPQEPHPEVATRLYKIWYGISNRLQVDKNYEQKGIQLCEQWKDFDTFKQWAEESGYTEELTIERENVFEDYTPDNCSWASMKEQGKNRANSKLWYIKGKWFEACIDAASHYKVSNDIIARWVEEQPDCYAVKRYNDDHSLKQDIIDLVHKD